MLETMMSMLALTAALVIAEMLQSAPPQLGAIALVAACVLAALLVSRLGPLALATGALAAIAWVMLRPAAPALAGAALVALTLAARTSRILLMPHRVLHSALSVTSGSVAGWTLVHFHSPFTLAAQPIAALVVSALVLGLPFLVSSEEPDTHALLMLARRSQGPARMRLLRAVALRRRAMSQMALRADERRALRRAFRELARAAEGMLDRSTPTGALAELIGRRLGPLQRVVRALADIDAEERQLDVSASEAAEQAADHAEARRDALRALAAGRR